MGLITYDKANFLASLEPGIVTLVVDAFEEKLAEKLDGIVAQVYEELRDELPEEIKVKVYSVFDIPVDREKINVEVELREPPEFNKE